MASTAYFNGKVLTVPQVRSRFDTSRLPKSGLLPSGIIGIVGEAEAGEPGVVHRCRSYAEAQAIFQEGDLLDGIQFCFSPTVDPEISGAQEVLAVKVNPSTLVQTGSCKECGSGLHLILRRSRPTSLAP